MLLTRNPWRPFFDLFLLGDGEEALPELLRAWAELTREHSGNRREILAALSRREGVYVPSLYRPPLPREGFSGDGAPGRKGPGTGAEKGRPGPGPGSLSLCSHRPLYRHSSRPGGPGAFPGLRPRLPLLPGGDSLPPRAPAQPGEAERDGPGAAAGHGV